MGLNWQLRLSGCPKLAGLATLLRREASKSPVNQKRVGLVESQTPSVGVEALLVHLELSLSAHLDAFRKRPPNSPCVIQAGAH